VISLALSKGRILDETLPLLEAAGVVATEHPDASRKLIIPTTRPDVRLIIVRATDVPTYVQYGAADLGVVGGDVLAEFDGTGLYQPIDLKIARCRLMVAVRRGFDYEQAVRSGARLRVASKYVQTAREHFAAKGVHVDFRERCGSAFVLLDSFSGGTVRFFCFVFFCSALFTPFNSTELFLSLIFTSSLCFTVSE
jgi:ATP phosphoribosyltransferase